VTLLTWSCGASPIFEAVSGAVLSLACADRRAVARLLTAYGLELVLAAPQALIAGSYWGEPEAGLQAHLLHARLDTPLHSILHEACHYICMSAARRARLERDAGGDDLEEAAVCYLQVLLADELDGVGRTRLCADMDAWGYSFRLGSTHAWFYEDAEDARAWLLRHGVIDASGRPTQALRS